MTASEGPQLGPVKVLVLGGAGFIGRHAVAALLHAGADVVIGSRHPERIDHRLPSGAATSARRQICVEEHLDADSWNSLINDVDVVLNCVGILRQRGRATYDRVHHLAPGALAKSCSNHGKRYVHVSALGLHADARSRFLTSKLIGEGAVKTSGNDWIIVRPSLLDGSGGFGAWWLRAVARLPVFVVPADANGLIAALDVRDLGEALTRLCLGSHEELRLGFSREFDLGGSTQFSLREYIRALRRTYTPRAALCIPIPGSLARLVAHLCDVLHATPFSFGHWELLRRDNVPIHNRLPELLKRMPKEAPSYVGLYKEY